MELEITDSDSLLDALQQVREAFKAGGKVTITLKSENGYTASQRGSLHIWCEQLANVLNEAGFDQTVFFRKYAKAGMAAPWSKTAIKELLYKPTLAALTNKDSTEDMNTLEPSEICTIIGASLSQRLGITPPAWPTRFGG